MPIIRVDIAKIPGEQKRALIEKLTAESASITGIPANAFTVIISEFEDDSIGVGGKILREVRQETP